LHWVPKGKLIITMFIVGLAWENKQVLHKKEWMCSIKLNYH
jgi:hypothetical protein